MKLSYEISGWEKNTNSQLERKNRGPALHPPPPLILWDLPPQSVESKRKKLKIPPGFSSVSDVFSSKHSLKPSKKNASILK